MKMFNNPWIVAILGILFGVGSQAGFYFMKLGPAKPAHEDAAHAAPEPVYAPPTLAWNFFTPSLADLRTELEKRTGVVVARGKELEDYAKRLAAERAELEKLKTDLEGMRGEIDRRREAFVATLLEMKESEQKNLKTLAATYTNLSPAAALAIFAEMEDETVVKILAFMKPEPVGLILEEMARTKEGENTMAVRAAAISNKLRLRRQQTGAQNT